MSADPGIPESVALAAGYAQAFEATGRSTVTITYTDSTQDVVITGIRSLAAYGGVLLVKMRGGSSQILDPARIVKMSVE